MIWNSHIIVFEEYEIISHDIKSWDGINVKSYIQPLIPSHDSILCYGIACPNTHLDWVRRHMSKG